MIMFKFNIAFALKNYLCTEHTLKNHGTLPSLEGTLTHEA
jgi:hypothetical protein